MRVLRIMPVRPALSYRPSLRDAQPAYAALGGSMRAGGATGISEGSGWTGRQWRQSVRAWKEQCWQRPVVVKFSKVS